MHRLRLNYIASVTVFCVATAGSLLAQQAPNAPGGGPTPPGIEGLSGLGGLGGLGQDQAQPVEVGARIDARPGSSQGQLVVTATIEEPYHIFSVTQPRGGPQPTKLRLKPNESVRLTGDFETTTPPKIHIDDGPWKGLRIEEHYGAAEWIAPIQIADGANLAELAVEGVVDTQACDPTVCIPLTLPFTARYQGGDAAPDEAPVMRLTGPTFQGKYAPKEAKWALSGYVEPAAVPPDGDARLVLSLTPQAGWHVYALADVEPKRGNKPTLIVLESTGGLDAGQASTEAEVIEKEPGEVLKAAGWPLTRYHHGSVTWTVPIQVPPSTGAGPRQVTGIIGFQVCQDNDGQCDFPRAARFAATLQVDPGADGSERQPLTFAAAEYPEAAEAAQRKAAGAPAGPTPPTSTPPSSSAVGGAENAADSQPESSQGYDLSKLEAREITLAATPGAADSGTAAESSVLYYLAIAFVGGLILNLMPCVLPVIGLKVMSFVQQAGHSRAQAFALNIWYAAGIVAVFLALAALAVGAGVGWGDQFSSVWFNVVLASLVFAMALSLLGVWEIPIPGFVGGNAASKLAEKEGPTGAFTKGVFTTVLATPCTGPFMATALGWAVQQPGETTFATFAAMGLGMASPYLLIGAFPSLVRFLPQPGTWMVTFKQVMGFILLGTVVFILSFMPPASTVPTVALLAGIGLACWFVSRIPATAEAHRKWTGWLAAGAIVGAAAWLSFGWLYADVLEPRLALKQKMEQDERVRTELETVLAGLRSAEGEEELAALSTHVQQRLATIDSGAYQAFSLPKLGRFGLEDQRTILVDFTADWCLTCQAFEAAVLHSDPVERAIESQDVITMRADYTDKPEHLARVLRALGSNGVPVIAIFPGNDPYRPFVFKGGYTKAGILAALRQAQEAPLMRAQNQSVETVAAARAGGAP